MHFSSQKSYIQADLKSKFIVLTPLFLLVRNVLGRINFRWFSLEVQLEQLLSELDLAVIDQK